jgi:hypothetical protein
MGICLTPPTTGPKETQRDDDRGPMLAVSWSDDEQMVTE